ncbi:MAG: DUF2148 domain-containing protein [Spirochaetia bacterium]|jgi:uncharacterized ferredoxin-like protein|nr:DUF2148 domain-containing protein [Spirochaetia bacterium]
MKITSEEDLRTDAVMDAAKRMMTAARTAPKAKGKDNLTIALLDKEGIKAVSDKLKEMHREMNLADFFLRDAVNILSADAMIIIGTKISSMGLAPCGMCGFADCAEKNKHPDHPCVFNTGDLGIAIGSAVSAAMDSRIDNRVIYTAGQAVLRMGILEDDVKIAYAVPLSVSSKNPFFDRKQEELLKNA